MKKLMLFSFLFMISFFPVFAWEFIPGNGISVCNFAESANGNRQLIGLNGGGYWLSNDAGSTWTPINDRILPPNASTFYPDKIFQIDMLDATGDTILTKYVCDRRVGWAYSITVDGGETWRVLLPPANTNKSSKNYASIDPINHNRIDYAVNGTFYTSYDLGLTWTDSTQYLQLFDDINGFTYNPANSDVLYTYGRGNDDHGINTSLSYSTTHGLSWNAPMQALSYWELPGLDVLKVLVLSNEEVLAFPKTSYDSQTPYREYLNSILRSTNIGMTWTLEENALPENYIIKDVIEIPGFPGHILVCPIGTLPQFFVHGNVGFDPWSTGQPYLSTDYGQTFSAVDSEVLSQHMTINSISVNPFSNSVYLNTDSEGVLKSNDGGRSWNHYPTVEHLGLGLYKHFKVSEDALLFSGENYKMKKFNLINENWVEYEIEGFNVDPDSSVFHSIPIVDNNGLTLITSTYAVPNDSLFLTRLLRKRSETSTWEVLSLPFDYAIHPKKDNSIDAFFSNSHSRFIMCDLATGRPRYCVSTDTGSTWDIPNNYPFRWFGRAILQREDDIFIMEECINIYNSSNDGRTWLSTDFPAGPEAWNNEMLLEDPNDGSIYTIYANHCYKYDGSSWNILSDALTNSYSALIPGASRFHSPTLFYNYQNRELFMSADGGYTWERFDEELPWRRQIAHFGQMEYDPWRNRLWISTSLGMMYADAEELLSVDEPGSAFIPLEAKPIYAYPNPFNASVNIRYQVDAALPISLKLYNISGQEISTLFSGVKQQGSHQLTFDASTLASGTYFLKLNDGINTHTQKITLAK